MLTLSFISRNWLLRLYSSFMALAQKFNSTVLFYAVITVEAGDTDKDLLPIPLLSPFLGTLNLVNSIPTSL